MIAPVALSALISEYDHVLLDLDGTVWIGDEPTPRAAEAVAALRGAGKRIAFVTNDASHSTEDYVRKLWSAGCQAAVEEVVTVGVAVTELLSARFAGGDAVVIGAPALWRHVSDAGLRIVNATDAVSRARVVVVASHEGFDYGQLRDATTAVLGGATLIGAARDQTYPQPDGPWPGSGAILAAVETAGGVRADVVVGKPEPSLFRIATERLGPGRALMVGDRLDSDVAGALAAGLDAALVLTGSTDRAAALAFGEPGPVAIAQTLAELVLGR
jgi:glycerol 3-phosphatase-2